MTIEGTYRSVYWDYGSRGTESVMVGSTAARDGNRKPKAGRGEAKEVEQQVVEMLKSQTHFP